MKKRKLNAVLDHASEEVDTWPDWMSSRGSRTEEAKEVASSSYWAQIRKRASSPKAKRAIKAVLGTPKRPKKFKRVRPTETEDALLSYLIMALTSAPDRYEEFIEFSLKGKRSETYKYLVGILEWAYANRYVLTHRR